MSELPRATNLLKPAFDTHVVPAIGEHTNPAGEKRTLISATVRNPQHPHLRYTNLTYLDAVRNVVREGSPAEWARWAAKGAGG